MERSGFLSEVFNALTPPQTSAPKRSRPKTSGLASFLNYQDRVIETLKEAQPEAPSKPAETPPDSAVVPSKTTGYFTKIAAVLGVFFTKLFARLKKKSKLEPSTL